VTEKVFLLGRPGSGKTTAFDYIRKAARDEKLQFTHHREYTTLQEMMQSDSKSKFRPAKYGGFEILDDSVFEESARRFEKRLRDYLDTAPEEEFIFIELARKEYKESMHYFNLDFLQDSYFLFIEADVETCVKRIHSRVAQSASTGNHFVPDHVLRDYYFQDNIEYMSSDFKTDFDIRKEVKTIDNRRSIDQFYAKVSDFAYTMFAASHMSVITK
jgi:adenylate kinase family enzyme